MSGQYSMLMADRTVRARRAVQAMSDGSYDEVLYRGLPHAQTHPDRLATLAALHGMAPARISRCRVLELGCGDGGNLIPLACQWPNSEFVGIDLGRRSLAAGRALIAGLGLANIRLEERDILDVGAELGSFDYVIAHGVYSWVPAPVRDKVLSIFRANLAPHGVAYVSYNCHPGAASRQLARDMMRYHLRGIDDPQARIEEGRALLRFLAQAATEETYRRMLAEQLELSLEKPDAVFYHDDLSASNTAFFLHEVVEEAERHGLQYLSDAVFTRADPRALPVAAAARDLTRDQYLDFITARAFRDTLLCHSEIELGRDIGADDLARFHLSAAVSPADPQRAAAAAGTAEFRTQRGETITTGHALSKAALLHLGDCWPRAVGCAELVAAAGARLNPTAVAEADRAAMAATLFHGVSAGYVELHLEPPRIAATVAPRPQASLMARRQAETGDMVTTLRHATVRIADPVARRFLTLADGTRDIDELAVALSRALAGTPEGAGVEVTPQGVRDNLAILLRLALLVD
jgi:SAM-dependent methyltransferase/methyltransferase-like protein